MHGLVLQTEQDKLVEGAGYPHPWPAPDESAALSGVLVTKVERKRREAARASCAPPWQSRVPVGCRPMPLRPPTRRLELPRHWRQRPVLACVSIEQPRDQTAHLLAMPDPGQCAQHRGNGATRLRGRCAARGTRERVFLVLPEGAATREVQPLVEVVAIKATICVCQRTAEPRLEGQRIDARPIPSGDPLPIAVRREQPAHLVPHRTSGLGIEELADDDHSASAQCLARGEERRRRSPRRGAEKRWDSVPP
mmetsp:Transcript_90758/g.256275  ORF Transcript_90758/g.256275 Transcript_90758/m.256275 type:complete len:251 (+) Transcript_90758:378-1130(+)